MVDNVSISLTIVHLNIEDFSAKPTVGAFHAIAQILSVPTILYVRIQLSWIDIIFIVHTSKFNIDEVRYRENSNAESMLLNT